MADCIAQVRKVSPEARLRSLTDAYNCFGMALGARRTHIHRNLDEILQEDGYRRISVQEVEVFDLVVYRSEEGKEAQHVAVVHKIDAVLAELGSKTRAIHVVSQWGSLGEYFHLASAVDQVRHGPHLEYWTDRIAYVQAA